MTLAERVCRRLCCRRLILTGRSREYGRGSVCTLLPGVKFALAGVIGATFVGGVIGGVGTEVDGALYVVGALYQIGGVPYHVGALLYQFGGNTGLGRICGPGGTGTLGKNSWTGMAPPEELFTRSILVEIIRTRSPPAPTPTIWIGCEGLLITLPRGRPL